MVKKEKDPGHDDQDPDLVQNRINVIPGFAEDEATQRIKKNIGRLPQDLVEKEFFVFYLSETGEKVNSRTDLGDKAADKYRFACVVLEVHLKPFEPILPEYPAETYLIKKSAAVESADKIAQIIPENVG